MSSPEINSEENITPKYESLVFSGNEVPEYKGKYKISNWDFEYAGEHYQYDVIMIFHKKNDSGYAIDRALDRIRTKLDLAKVDFDWSGSIDLQNLVDLYTEHITNDRKRMYSIFETSGVFSIERLGYEELRDQILTRIPPEDHYKAERIIEVAIKQN